MILAARHHLVFDCVAGIGFLPFTESHRYGSAYFNEYAAMGRTSFGVALNSLRVGLVASYMASDALIDIGVGDGAFVRARGGATYGYDINPVAVEMLRKGNLWRDTSELDAIPAASFWDSLEHIEYPETIVSKVQRYCFVSLPVFRDEAHILTSKHYKPNEHCWYFTRHGLIAWFWGLGFVCVEMNDMETQLGREDIGTFVFRRIGA